MTAAAAPAEARPLDRFPLVRTQDAEDMCAALARVYAKPTLYLERGTRKVDVALNFYPMKAMGLGYTKYGIDMSMAYPESNFTLQTFPMRGRGEVTIDHIASPLHPQRGLTVSPGTSFAVKLNADYEHCLLVLNTKALCEKLAALTGAPIDRPLRFDPIREMHSAAKALRDHFLFLVDMVSTTAAPLSELVLAEFEQTLMMMTLHANRHNYSHLLQEKALAVAPSQVHRAEEYIEANWRAPIALEDVAEAAGVRDLGLFRTFKNRRGVSMTEFAKTVRLHHARELLRQPDAAATVAEIAAACGFADLGRFNSDYAKAFGEEPWQTLGRYNGADTDPAKH